LTFKKLSRIEALLSSDVYMHVAGFMYATIWRFPKSWGYPQSSSKSYLPPGTLPAQATGLKDLSCGKAVVWLHLSESLGVSGRTLLIFP